MIIPDGVTKIEPFAFEDCTNLCSVIIPDTVVSADTEHCGNKGEIFRGCPKLKTIGAIGSGCWIKLLLLSLAKQEGVKKIKIHPRAKVLIKVVSIRRLIRKVIKYSL